MSLNRKTSLEVSLNLLEEEDAIEDALENPTVLDPETPHTPFLAKSIGNETVNLHSGSIRWVALVFCAFSCMGNFFCGTLMGSLQTDIMKAWEISLTQLNATNSLGHVPSLVLPLISGIVINRVGLKTSFLISSVICFIAYCIITYGITQANLKIILIGNVVSTFGENPLGICRNAMLVKWFVGKELSFALGFVLCVNRLGSSVCSFIAPTIYKFYKNLAAPYYVGLCVMLFGFLNICALAYVDRKTDNQLKLEFPELAALKKKRKKHITLSDLKDFKLIYLIVIINIAFQYMAVFGFIGNGNDILQKRFNFDSEEAGRLMTIIYLCPLIVTPAMGALTDKIGKRPLIIFITAGLLIIIHLGIALMEDAEPGQKKYSIIVGLVCLGVTYSSYAAIIWPCVALVVSEKLTGLAYGLSGIFSTVLGMGYPTLLGYIHDQTKDDPNSRHGYFWTEIFLMGGAFIAMLMAGLMYHVDKKQNRGKLSKPGTERHSSARSKVYSHSSIE